MNVVAAFKIGRVKKGKKKRKRECVLNLLKMKTNWNFVLPAWLPLQSHFPASHSSSLCGWQTCLGAMSTTYSSAGSPKCACAYSSPAPWRHSHFEPNKGVNIRHFAFTEPGYPTKKIGRKKKKMMPSVVTKVHFFLGFLWALDVALIINFIYTGVEHREFAFMVRITKLSTNCGGPSEAELLMQRTTANCVCVNWVYSYWPRLSGWFLVGQDDRGMDVTFGK